MPRLHLAEAVQPIEQSVGNDSLILIHVDHFVLTIYTSYFNHRYRPRRVRTEMSLALKPLKPPKPDHLRRPSSRSPLRLPDRPTAVPAPTSSPGATYITYRSSILADALEALGPDNRELISILLLPTNAIIVDATINEVYTRARVL
jgi:hypothetical protein